MTYDGNLEEAFIGQAITLTLENEIDVSRGDMLVHSHDLPLCGNRFNAKLVWMAEQAMEPGKLYDIKVGTTIAAGNISQLHNRIDVNTLATSDAPILELNEIGDCEITLNKSVSFDNYDNNRGTGAFIIIDRLTNVTVGAGMISGIAKNDKDGQAVDQGEREKRFAQSATTVKVATDALAVALERRLFEAGHLAVFIKAPTQDALAALSQAGLITISTTDGDLLEGDNVDQLLNQLTAKQIIK